MRFRESHDKGKSGICNACKWKVVKEQRKVMKEQLWEITVDDLVQKREQERRQLS